MKKRILDSLIKTYHFSNTWTGTIIIVLFVIFFIAQAFRIPSGSMKDSLLIGDHLFAKKFAYGIPTPHLPFLELPLVPGTDGHIYDGDTPQRGDIVIFRPPHDLKTHFVKRCVALPGDELFVLAKVLYLHPREGNEYAKKAFSKYELKEIDGKLWVKDPYTLEHPGIHHDDNIIDNGAFPPEIFNTQTIIVPQGEYFMMGDNRDHSNDSRFWGAVPYGLVEGTPWFVYFSMEMRSYDEVNSTSSSGADYTSLENICPHKDITSEECKKQWEKHRYEIRWNRIGKTPTDLEQGDILKSAKAQ